MSAPIWTLRRGDGRILLRGPYAVCLRMARDLGPWTTWTISQEVTV